MKPDRTLVLYNDEIVRLEEISFYIDNNMKENLGTERLASQFKLGLWTLRRHFQVFYKQPVHNYVLERRMLKSMELLLERKYSIKQIGVITGYKRHTSFTHAFTKYFGHPPAYFLRNSLDGETQ